MVDADQNVPEDEQPIPPDKTDAQVLATPAGKEQSEQPDKAIVHTHEPVVEEHTHLSSSTTSQRGQTGSPFRPVIVVRNLTKTYVMGGNIQIAALQGVSLDIYPGEFVAVMGPSGSGKSTFMNIIGCLDRPSSGEYWLSGKLVSQLNSDELAHVRNQMIGFVFQGFNLLARANALQNVALPMVYAGLPRSERERRARKILQLVGLGTFAHHRPTELSGGQQQRVAIARALVNGPLLLLADEPTGNLDSHTGIEVMAVLQALNEQGMTIVLVTHDPKIAQYAKRQVGFLDGHAVRDEPVQAPRSAHEEWLSQEDKATLDSPV